MIKRTIEISRRAAYVSARLGQLIVQPFGEGKDAASSIPAEDIGIVVVDHPRVTYSHGALQALVEAGACVVFCGRNHQPTGLLLPISGHTQQVERLRLQIAASRPTVKRLWRQVVTAKVVAQARALPEGIGSTRSRLDLHRRRLSVLASEVRSGDTSNVEAHAARVYWSGWRCHGGDALHRWRRDPNGADPLNGFLNYGYAILRAAVARALVAAGLHPALGLHHRHRANPFCLADDLMEPLRPMVDREAFALMRDGREELDQASKARFLTLLAAPCKFRGDRGPLMVQLHRVTASFVRCLEGRESDLPIPWPVAFDEPGRDGGGY